MEWAFPPREPNHHFAGKQTWPDVKGWPMEIISTGIQEHNPGGQPCNFLQKMHKKQKTKMAAINISYVEVLLRISCVTYGF